MNSTKIVIVALVLIIIGGVIYLLLTRQSPVPVETPLQTEIENATENPVQETSELTELEVEDAVIIDMSGKDFEFSQDRIQVKKGDTVTINFTSEGGFHDWVVDEFDAATEQVNTGEMTSVTFVADTVGEFEYYCSVMQHREMGMVGTLVVTE